MEREIERGGGAEKRDGEKGGRQTGVQVNGTQIKSHEDRDRQWEGETK